MLEASTIGLALIMFALVGGTVGGGLAGVGARLHAQRHRRSRSSIIVYGFAASALPVWLLLAPRDYLSAFVKVGAILALAVGIIFVQPDVHMPPLTRFIDGTRSRLRGRDLPVLLHHHRLRRHLAASTRSSPPAPRRSC